ncbi:MAG: amidohydrolase [Flavobacteriaceae bacterium]
MKQIALLFVITILFSCTSEKAQVDLLVKGATIYTVNSSFETVEAFAVKDGKIIEVGASKDLENKYEATKILMFEGKTIVPGLIDAHAHLYNLGVSMQQVNLYGTKSFEDVLERVIAFQKEKNTEYILGRGWDQNDWSVKEYPTKKELDSLYPNIPVALTRIDGHAFIANSKALELAGITANTKLEGGEVILINGEPSGVLIDTPMSLVRKTFPKQNAAYHTKVLKEAEKKCLKLGLTTVNDAGLDREIIELIDSLQQKGELSMRVYAMVSNSKENLEYYLAKGKIKTDRLNVRSIKIYADGALGSRGAALKNEYSDMSHHFGAMITPMKQMDSLATIIAKAGYQMNTHAIGDSANVSVLKVYTKVLKNEKDPRWRVEHSQIVSLSDFDCFSEKILPSIQPTHATSDMYWAEDRIGSERIKGAYAYKTLLKKSGMVALGTDFPIEKVNPMHTFYSAVARKDLNNYPAEGYRKEEALTREETLKGMTIWAAYSNFEENEKGSIEVGKLADFTILDTNIMTCSEDDIPTIQVLATYINGEKVYEKGLKY